MFACFPSRYKGLGKSSWDSYSYQKWLLRRNRSFFFSFFGGAFEVTSHVHVCTRMIIFRCCFVVVLCQSTRDTFCVFAPWGLCSFAFGPSSLSLFCVQYKIFFCLVFLCSRNPFVLRSCRKDLKRCWEWLKTAFSSSFFSLNRSNSLVNSFFFSLFLLIKLWWLFPISLWQHTRTHALTHTQGENRATFLLDLGAFPKG